MTNIFFNGRFLSTALERAPGKRYLREGRGRGSCHSLVLFVMQHVLIFIPDRFATGRAGILLGQLSAAATLVRLAWKKGGVPCGSEMAFLPNIILGRQVRHYFRNSIAAAQFLPDSVWPEQVEAPKAKEEQPASIEEATIGELSKERSVPGTEGSQDKLPGAKEEATTSEPSNVCP